jgi:hypothetical protein
VLLVPPIDMPPMDMAEDVVAEEAVLVVVVAVDIVEEVMPTALMALMVQACWVFAGVYRRRSYKVILYLALERSFLFARKESRAERKGNRHEQHISRQKTRRCLEVLITLS